MMEMQTVLAELITHFKFSLPRNKPTIQPILMTILNPIVENELEKGPQMPLTVNFIN
jgi:cytochrome P450